MNLRGIIGVVGLGVVMAGCAQSGTTTALQSAARPEAKQVAQALLSDERVQALAATEPVRYDASASKARIYQALGAERAEGTYQALKATLSR